MLIRLLQEAVGELIGIVSGSGRTGVRQHLAASFDAGAQSAGDVVVFDPGHHGLDNFVPLSLRNAVTDPDIRQHVHTMLEELQK